MSTKADKLWTRLKRKISSSPSFLPLNARSDITNTTGITNRNLEQVGAIGFTTLSEEAVKAITNLKEVVKKPDKKRKNITRETLKNCQGHKRRYKLFGDREEFHNVDRDKNNVIIEPTDSFRAVITTSKNNVHIQVVNKSKNYKTIFGSFAGNVGFTKSLQQSERCAYRIGENIAKKCKRLGIFSIDIKFRRIMRVETVLQAMYANNLNITQIIHEPRLPKCGLNASKPRKRRRV
ncbi:ribosomal protein S11 [Plasmodium ovale wallikeri]|uniref:Ribosomal protein S11 n=1 Tax=Plasmodium ovale wallikeri TaxID=864142 RepID=A0A1A8ZH97_PLAOA|nr:ribosomal protein S11 [Plasmodium ovale wallikeri]SBT43250.1 ribosomal protein S11 [Plasmodium ovale wallikeri]